MYAGEPLIVVRILSPAISHQFRPSGSRLLLQVAGSGAVSSLDRANVWGGGMGVSPRPPQGREQPPLSPVARGRVTYFADAVVAFE